MYTVKIGNSIMPDAASTTESTSPVPVLAKIFDPTVVTFIKAHRKDLAVGSDGRIDRMLQHEKYETGEIGQRQDNQNVGNQQAGQFCCA